MSIRVFWLPATMFLFVVATFAPKTAACAYLAGGFLLWLVIEFDWLELRPPTAGPARASFVKSLFLWLPALAANSPGWLDAKKPTQPQAIASIWGMTGPRSHNFVDDGGVPFNEGVPKICPKCGQRTEFSLDHNGYCCCGFPLSHDPPHPGAPPTPKASSLESYLTEFLPKRKKQ